METNKFETVSNSEGSNLLSIVDIFKRDFEKFELDNYGDVKLLYEGRLKLYEKFIEKLIDIKEKFLYIFKTENGSIYFVTPDRKTLRVKRKKYDYELCPLSDEIVFRDDRGNKLNEPTVGLSPFEIFNKGEYEKYPAYHEGHNIVEIIK